MTPFIPNAPEPSMQSPTNDSKFYKLPAKLASMRDIQSGAKILLAVILNYQADKGYCWPGIQTLMKDTGLARQTVLDAISSLERLGLLTVDRQGKGKKNYYKTSPENRPVQKIDQSRIQTTTGLKNRPEPVQKLDFKRLRTNKKTYIYMSDSAEYGLAELLFNLILKRKSDFRKPNLQRWAKDIDHMIRLDGRTSERIEAVIRWSQADSGNGHWRGWQNNILSTAKLREKFDVLELQKARKNQTVNSREGQFERVKAAGLL